MQPAPEISQRDLRQRSREIMDALEAGARFTVTRDGRGIGELVPLARRRRFVPRSEFRATSTRVALPDLAAWRRETDAAVDPDLDDPYAR